MSCVQIIDMEVIGIGPMSLNSIEIIWKKKWYYFKALHLLNIYILKPHELKIEF